MNIRRRNFVQLVGFGLVMPIVGCTASTNQNATPRVGADIRGTITQVNQAITGDILGSLLVEGKLETDTHYDRASITITKQTVVLEQQGQNRRSITFADLQKGQLVQVGFIGAVAETYPVQAQADEVVILK